MEKLEIPVEKLNGSRLSFWEAINNMTKQITEKNSDKLRGTSSMEELKPQDGTFVQYFFVEHSLTDKKYAVADPRGPLPPYV